MHDHYIFVASYYDRKDNGTTRAFTTHAAALQYKRDIAMQYAGGGELWLDASDEEVSDWWDRQFPAMSFNIDEIPLED